MRAACRRGIIGGGSIEGMEGKALGAHLVWLQGQRATSKSRSWCTEHSPTGWAWLLPGPRVLPGIPHGCRGLSEGRSGLHHPLLLPVETTYKPLLTPTGLRLSWQAVFCQNKGLEMKCPPSPQPRQGSGGGISPGIPP